MNHNKFLKRVARSICPCLSSIIIYLGLTDFIRKLIAFLNYLIGQGAGNGWALEREVEVAIRCIKQKNPVVLDIGANIGHWSAIFRRHINGGIVYMFEPQIQCLSKIKELNLMGVEVLGVGVGEFEEKLNLYSTSDVDDMASLYQRQDTFLTGAAFSKREVKVICIDDFIRERSINFIDFVKLDIEGHELSALKGMKCAIQSKIVGSIAFEFGSGNLNSRTIFRDFWDLLSKDYKISLISSSGSLVEIIDYYEDLEYYRGVSNFIAILK